MRELAVVLFSITLAWPAPARAGEPGWVKEWLAASLPAECEEARHRDEYRNRGKMPKGWEKESTRALTIHLVDAATGKPIAEALLSSWQTRQVAFSDAKGTVGPLPWYCDDQGKPHVTASAPGYKTGGDWASDDKGEVFVALVKEDRLLVRGKVTASGKPAPGCSVALLPVEAAGEGGDEGEPRAGGEDSKLFDGVAYKVLASSFAQGTGKARTTTDADGGFALFSAARGKLEVVASLPNAGLARVALDPAKPVVALALDPKAGDVVAGIVVDAKGKPVRGIEIADEHSAARAVTGADGRFSFKNCHRALYYFDIHFGGRSGPESIHDGAYEDQKHDDLRIVVR